jgi:hypothetical protein
MVTYTVLATSRLCASSGWHEAAFRIAGCVRYKHQRLAPLLTERTTTWDACLARNVMIQRPEASSPDAIGSPQVDKLSNFVGPTTPGYYAMMVFIFDLHMVNTVCHSACSAGFGRPVLHDLTTQTTSSRHKMPKSVSRANRNQASSRCLSVAVLAWEFHTPDILSFGQGALLCVYLSTAGPPILVRCHMQAQQHNTRLFTATLTQYSTNLCGNLCVCEHLTHPPTPLGQLHAQHRQPVHLLQR